VLLLGIIVKYAKQITRNAFGKTNSWLIILSQRKRQGVIGKNKMEEQTVEIEAVVDKFMTVKLNVPKKIDAGTLLSVIQRLQRILKVSPLPESLQNSVKKERKEGTGRGRKSSYDFLNDRNKAIEVTAKWKNSDTEQRKAIAESYGTSKSKIDKSVYYAQRKFNITPEEIQQKTTQ
jgi:hypothetical protein